MLQLLTAQLQNHSPCPTAGTAPQGTRDTQLGAAGIVGDRAGFGDRAGKHPPDRQSGYGWLLGMWQREASRSPARRNPRFEGNDTERSDIWCTCPNGYRGKHIEEARLCHSGNMAEYIYTHVHTHTRDFLTL